MAWSTMLCICRLRYNVVSASRIKTFLVEYSTRCKTFVFQILVLRDGKRRRINYAFHYIPFSLKVELWLKLENLKHQKFKANMMLGSFSFIVFLATEVSFFFLG